MPTPAGYLLKNEQPETENGIDNDEAIRNGEAKVEHSPVRHLEQQKDKQKA
jgi:hypothetical protein